MSPRMQSHLHNTASEQVVREVFRDVLTEAVILIQALRLATILADHIGARNEPGNMDNA